MPYPRLYARLVGRPLCIEAAALEALTRGMESRILAGAPAPREAVEEPGQWQGLMGGGDRVAKLAQRLDAGADAGQPRRPFPVTPEGVAILPVIGELVQRHDWMVAQSGLTSYERLSGWLAMAYRDPEVRAILLLVDSPGGEAAGCLDLAEQVFKARGAKPIWAVANDRCTSAAYMLGCACDRLLVSSLAQVGSIGVAWLHVEYSKAEAAAGYKWTVIKSGPRKDDFSPHKPLDKKALELAQAEVGREAGLMFAMVARNRGLEAETVEAMEAGIFNGPDAVEAGLADEVLTIERPDEDLAGLAARRLYEATAAGDLAGGAVNTLTLARGATMPESTAPAPGAANPTPPAPASGQEPAGAAQAPAAPSAQAAAPAAPQGDDGRARVQAILQAPEAEGRRKLAEHLAFNSNMTAEEAVAALKASGQTQAQGGNPLAQAMAGLGEPNTPPDGGGIETNTNTGQVMLGRMAETIAARFGGQERG